MIGLYIYFYGLDTLMYWALWHQSMSTYSQPFFPVAPGREVGYGCAN